MSEALTAAFEPLPTRPTLPLVRAKRRSPLRTLLTFSLLVVLTAAIILYLHFTDPARVRALAQQILTDELGGHVSVGHASLSIFEGLRLDNLRISTADRSQRRPLLEAKSLQVHFDLKSLLSGQIVVQQVLAVEPHVYLVEDVDNKQWLYPGMEQPSPKKGSSGPAKKRKPPEVQEVLVRDARIDYAQIINGQRSDVGTLNFEGQIAPDESGFYRFRMQSRGGQSATFPIAEGWLKPDGSQVGLVVRDVEFVDEIKTLLPAMVRRFWEEHHLAGRMAQTRVNYFRKPDGKAGFKVETVLDNVQMMLPPSAWMGPEDTDRVNRWRSDCAILASPVMGGSPVAAAIGNAMNPSGLTFDQVDGTFVFTDERIQIQELVARFENNRFKVTGTMGGYDPGAPLDVRLESLKSENIFIPESPAYIASMPWPVQEIYYRFKPKGGCSFWFHAQRDVGQKKPTLDGEVTIKDASFTFDRVPYPMQHGYGTLRLLTDPKTGEDALDIVSVRGHGYDGGANEKGRVEITGRIMPLDDRAGVDVRIVGKNVKSEPRLIASLPPQTRAAVEGLDPQHTGKLPSFDADFTIDVHRPIGLRQPTDTTTSLVVSHAAGMIGAFPYPIRDADASLKIFDDHLELAYLKMKRGDATLTLGGTVNWMQHDPVTHLPLVQPDLRIDAKNVPIDDELTNALPEQKRGWLKNSGLAGNLDVSGTITTPNPTTEDTALDLAVSINNATLKPLATKVPLTDVKATGRMTISGMTLTSFSGKFENAALQGTGTMRWEKDSPSATAAVRATGVAVDDALLGMLPESARKQVQSLAAKGTFDADLDYAAADKTDFRLAVHPKQIEMKPDFFPVTLTQVRGDVIIDPDRVRLVDLSAVHKSAQLVASGTIEQKNGAARLQLAGRNWTLDDSVRKALPSGLREFVNSTHLTGGLAFDVPSLQMSLAETTTQPAAPDAFNATIWLQKASFTAGADVTDAKGQIKLNGTVAGGALQTLTGALNFDSATIADRPVSNMTADIRKPGDRDLLQITNIDAHLAGGVVAGRVETTLDKADPRFAVALQIRDAKAGELSGDNVPLEGKVSGSLQMEGKWDDSGARRGRGDVIVEGHDMYRVPIAFGLMQIANLSLPTDSPLRRAGLRYSIDGQKMSLEQIDLRSANSAMQGSGLIDFGTRQVSMTLSLADSPADAVPVFGPLFKSARQDLLQIKVRGTLSEPKVKAQAFNTFSTTVDEVMKGKQ